MAQFKRNKELKFETMDALKGLKLSIAEISRNRNLSFDVNTIGAILASVIGLNHDFTCRIVDSHEWLWCDNCFIADLVLAHALIQTWSEQLLLLG